VCKGRGVVEGGRSVYGRRRNMYRWGEVCIDEEECVDEYIYRDVMSRGSVCVEDVCIRDEYVGTVRGVCVRTVKGSGW